MNRINIHSVPFQPNLPKVNQTQQVSNNTFASYLETFTSEQPIKISKHANDRINLRNIEITQNEWDVIATKVNEAKQKGVNQPLVILDQAALIVSAKNNTVITALDREEAKQQLFTNIDGTIVL